MKIKAGVSLLGLKPEMVVALMVAEPIIKRYTPAGLVITSGVEGRHSKKTSKHYVGYGLDLRSRDIAEEFREEVAQKIGEDLGPEYYVAFEKDHFHISYNGSVKT